MWFKFLKGNYIVIIYREIRLMCLTSRNDISPLYPSTNDQDN